MQTESGQELGAIVARKELERRAGDGTFCWGVGNAPGNAAATLAKLGARVDTVFSVMKSAPRAVDVRPEGILVWRSYIDAEGAVRSLGSASLVTSRASSEMGRKRAHYALMCRSETPLVLGDYGSFDPAAYRNVGGTGAPVGSSQVTALLRRICPEAGAGTYRVNLRAELTQGYWVKLANPIWLSADQRLLYDKLPKCAPGLREAEWLEIVSLLREGDSIETTLPSLFGDSE